MPDETPSPFLPAAANGASSWPLATLRDCFALLVTGPRPLALDGTPIPGLPDRAVALDELRDRLMAHDCPQATRDAAWAAVIHRSRIHGGAWTVGAAGMGLPALRAVSRRLALQGAPDPADVQAEVLCGYLEALATVRLDLPKIAVRLRWAAYRAGLGLLTQTLASPHPDPNLFRTHAAHEQSAGSPEEVLAGAVVDGVLTAVEADLIAATRLEDTSVGTWAARTKVPQRTAYRIRERAEGRLTAHLTGQAPPDPPLSPRALTGRPVAAVTA